MSVGINQLMLGMSYYILGPDPQCNRLVQEWTRTWGSFEQIGFFIPQGMPCWRSRLHVPPWAVFSPSWALQRCDFEEPHVICCALWLGTSWNHEPRGVFFLLPIWQMLADSGCWILFDAVFCPCWSCHWWSQPQRFLWVLFTVSHIMKAQVNLTWIMEYLKKFDILGIFGHSSFMTVCNQKARRSWTSQEQNCSWSLCFSPPALFTSLKMALRLGKRTLRYGLQDETITLSPN